MSAWTILVGTSVLPSGFLRRSMIFEIRSTVCFVAYIMGIDIHNNRHCYVLICVAISRLSKSSSSCRNLRVDRPLHNLSRPLSCKYLFSGMSRKPYLEDCPGSS